MHFLDKLTPAFLKKIDRHLLLNKRMLWESRIHYVLFFGGIGVSLSVLLGLFMPLSTNSNLPEIAILVALTLIPSVIALFFWGYKQYTYSIEREFGKPFSFMSQERMFLNLVSVVIIAAPIVLLPVIVSERISYLVTPEELEHDREVLNMGDLLVMSGYSRSYTGQNFYDLLACAEEATEAEDCLERYDNVLTSYQNMYGSTSYYKEIQNGYGSTDFIYSHPVFKTNKDVIEFIEISDEEASNYIEEYRRVFAKYSGTFKYTNSEILERWRSRDYLPAGERLHQQKENVRGQLNKIASAHQESSINQKWLQLGLACVFVFGLASIVNTIKVVTIRELLIAGISLGGLFVVGTVATVIMAQLGLMSEESFAMLFASTAYLIALTVSIKLTGKSTYSMFKAVSLTLASLFTPGLLLWTVLVGREMGASYSYFEPENAVALLLIGIAIYTLALYPQFHKRFRLLRALPQNS